jgi:hypothetical protein
MQERYYYLEDYQKAAIGTAAAGAVAIGTALAQRPRKELSEVEKRCGKKGRRGKKAAAEWEKCAASQPNTNTTPTPPTNDPKPSAMSKNTKIALIAGGSLLVITVITLIVLKRKKK